MPESPLGGVAVVTVAVDRPTPRPIIAITIAAAAADAWQSSYHGQRQTPTAQPL